MNELIERMAEAIANSWNFCGDQKEAARQVFDDHNMKFNEELYFRAIERADEIWKGEKK